MVYVFHSPANGRFKVGISRVPEKRYREIRSQVPDLEVLHLLDLPNTAEPLLHKRLRAYARPLPGCGIGSTEWFDVSGLALLDDLLAVA